MDDLPSLVELLALAYPDDEETKVADRHPATTTGTIVRWYVCGLCGRDLHEGFRHVHTLVTSR